MKIRDNVDSPIQAQNTPIVQLTHPIYDKTQVSLALKCDYLNHPTIAGNKYWKLKYNLLAAQRNGQRLLTFGGAYSNHIHATAAAGAAIGLPTIGLIRGELPTPLNPTLAFAQTHGMTLIATSRSDYRRRYDPDYLAALQHRYPDALLLPEGGSNPLAIHGCTELLSPDEYARHDFIACAVGTGGTLAGLAAAAPTNVRLLAFPALKGAQFLAPDVAQLQQAAGYPPRDNITWLHDYHFGGYAKHRPELIDFINTFKAQHAIPLDPIYTGKLLYGLHDLIAQGFFPAGSRVLAIHSGGLQGIAGFNARYGPLLHT